jgi:hypothetical protein
LVDAVRKMAAGSTAGSAEEASVDAGAAAWADRLAAASAAAGATIAVAVEGCAGVTGTDSAFGAATDAVAVGSTGAGIAPGPPVDACIDCALELNRARASAEFMSVRGPHEAVVATTAAASVAAIEPRHAGAARRGRWVC